MRTSMSRTVAAPNCAAPNFAAAIAPGPSADIPHGPGSSCSLSRQLDTLREMLCAMDSLTIGGRAHTMRKVVGFIKDQVERLGPATSPRNRQALAELTKLLRIESERQSPDVHEFSVRAERLIVLLGALT